MAFLAKYDIQEIAESLTSNVSIPTTLNRFQFQIANISNICLKEEGFVDSLDSPIGRPVGSQASGSLSPWIIKDTRHRGSRQNHGSFHG